LNSIALPICQNLRPIRKPNIPPATEAMLQNKAYLKALLGKERPRAINKTSGGTGKKDDSVKARMKRAGVP